MAFSEAESVPSNPQGSNTSSQEGIDSSPTTSFPGDMSSAIDSIEAAVGALREVDRASLAALQSKNVPVRDTTLRSVDSSLDALEALVLSANKLTRELCQRRVHMVINNHSIQNAALPVMRLLPDILPLIIEFVAHVWEAGEQYDGKLDLGWFKTGHVCQAWRRTVNSLASLWARELGTFSSLNSISTTLSRAQDAPLTIRHIPQDETRDLPTHLWSVFSQSYNIETVAFDLKTDDMDHFVAILNRFPSVSLRNLTLWDVEDRPEEPYATVVSFPNLQHLLYGQVCIPFQAPNLVSLCIISDSTPTLSASCTNFLDVLESCQKLVSLELSCWTSALDLNAPHRKVRLPHLQTLIAADPENMETNTPLRYIDLCQQLDLPSLKYLALQDYSKFALDALTFVFGWLLSSKQRPPCMEGISVFSLDVWAWTGQSWRSGDEIIVCLDDGSLESIKARRTIKRIPYGPNLQDRRGIRIDLAGAKVIGEDILNDALFDDIITSCLNAGGHSVGVPVIRTACFTLQDVVINWSIALQPLVDAEVLHVSCQDFPRLLPALSEQNADGTVLLPRLRAIICYDAENLANPLRAASEAKDRAKIAKPIRQMLRARAALGTPMTHMQAVARDMKGWKTRDQKQKQADEEVVNTFLAKLVSVYV